MPYQESRTSSSPPRQVGSYYHYPSQPEPHVAHQAYDQSGYGWYGESSGPLSAMLQQQHAQHPVEDHDETPREDPDAQIPYRIVEFGLSKDEILQLAKSGPTSKLIGETSLQVIQAANRQCGVSQKEINEIKQRGTHEKTCAALNHIFKSNRSNLYLYGRRFDESGNEVKLIGKNSKKTMMRYYLGYREEE